MRRFLPILSLLLFLQACGGQPHYSNDGFRAVEFTDIKAWQNADFTDTAQALRNSCASLRRAAGDKTVGGTTFGLQYGDWQEICSKAPTLRDADMQSFLQARFQPLFLQKEAFFTGYFEAHMNVSAKRDDKYRFPVLAPPGSEVPETADTVGTLQTLPKGYDRRRIENEAASGKFTILFWGDSPIDLFLAQIQGSARVRYLDGRQGRIGFGGHNGYSYVSIGKYLLETKRVEALPDGWFSIRDYLLAHPQEAQEIMWQNPRYIFFRPTADNRPPVGRLRTPLISNRSAAADDDLMPFGAPIWVEPQEAQGLAIAPRLMFIHDTGSAIKGLGRTDLFFGSGDVALNTAARLRNPGKLYILVPKKYLQRVNSS